MTWRLAPLALLLASALHAQEPQHPWQGRGAVPRDPAPSSPAESATGARAVALVGMTVGDMERSVRFYTQVLDFTAVSDDQAGGASYDSLQGLTGTSIRVVRLRLGDEYLQLTEYLSPRGRPAPADARSNDRWFQHVAIIVSDMDSAYARLRRFGVREVSAGPQLLPKTIPNAAGIRAFYFKDPDEHPLEVLQFPPDKGDPKWHRRTGRLFLGIDHTAIVVRDTRRSLAFYRDALGLRIAGESVNFGSEQARLNHVPGARLHITGLRAAAGPGIEFLQYLHPSGGRPYPGDERPNDLVHWQTTVSVPDLAAAARTIRQGGYRVVSLGVPNALVVRDPDGHAVQLVEDEGVRHAQQ
jgi:catechol 2,3-dioxygenase-like lactoylglutathione lyase family enzyme